MSNKRKHHRVPLSVKLDALLRLDNGVPIKTIARELNVGYVTVFDWKRNRDKLQSWHLAAYLSNAHTRPRIRPTDSEKTGKALYDWYSSQSRIDTHITASTLRQKALEFSQTIEEDRKTFVCSNGWLRSWRKRYGIELSEKCDETLSTDDNGEDASGMLSVEMSTDLEYEIDLQNDEVEPDISHIEELPIDLHEDIKQELSSNEDWQEDIQPINHFEGSNRIEQTQREFHQDINQELISFDDWHADTPEEGPPQISHAEGLNRIEQALEYVRQQKEATAADILFFQRWAQQAAGKRDGGQSKITDYFTKNN